ncbi:unnamed protein product [Porites evermanni]|uniref:Uncharacterized protein n=1 Tax=Porites evermanni TaxID=104178 RepID=A0ABN8M276_9CNID|nr:unnamed protein product [Porites evermanni]
MEKASRWIQYFKDVLNRPELNEIEDLDPSDYRNVNANQPSQVEDDTATKAMKNGKTPGINSLQAEEAICTKSLKTKIRLYNSNVKAALLCGSKY